MAFDNCVVTDIISNNKWNGYILYSLRRIGKKNKCLKGGDKVIRIPIDDKRKLKTIMIGTPKELSQIYGTNLLEDLQELKAKEVVICEYKDGTLNYTQLK